MSTEPATPLSVLVVEDNPDVAESTAQLLNLFGHRVRIADTGGEALAAAAGGEPDVILVDVGLPGMDGWEVVRRVRARTKGKRPFVVVVTGYGHDEDRRRSEHAGADLHLVKPVDPGFLLALLGRLGRRARAGR